MQRRRFLVDRAYAPFLMKMLASPTGPPVAPQMLWADFAKRFFI